MSETIGTTGGSTTDRPAAHEENDPGEEEEGVEEDPAIARVRVRQDLRFRFNGQWLRDEHTPVMLQMEDEALIDVLPESSGFVSP